MNFKLAVVIWFISLVGYAVYTFGMVDPNVILSSNSIYLNIQHSLFNWWQLNQSARTVSYGVLVLALFGSYIKIVNTVDKRNFVMIIGASVFILCLSYPALTHDIYNYIMNAKMVWVYKVNPHTHSASEFANDRALLHMHNVTTVAPYGYGWTAISLPIYAVARDNVKLNFLLYRLLYLMSLYGVMVAIKKIDPRVTLKDLALLGLNPLVLIETYGNLHNDIVMMMLGLWAVVWIKRFMMTKKWWQLGLALGLFIASISIKYVTMVWIPIGILYGLNLQGKILKQKIDYVALGYLSLIVPLVTTQSQRFLSWYLIWGLCLIPMLKNNKIKRWSIYTSLAGLLAYLLIIYTDVYSPTLLIFRTLILFGLPIGIYVIDKTKWLDIQGKTLEGMTLS